MSEQRSSSAGQPSDASPKSDRVRFPDLVRAREAQQEKLRLALLDQNRDLQRRLEESSPARGQSQDTLHLSPDVSPTPSAPSANASATTQPADGAVSAAAKAGGQQQQRQATATPPPVAATAVESRGAAPAAAGTAGPAVDMSALLNQVRGIILEAQDAQAKAFAAHCDAVDERMNKMQDAIDDLSTAVHKDESARTILRDEQMQQHMELCSEMDALRGELADSSAARREEVREITRETVDRLEAVVSDCESRVGAAEELPVVVRNDLAAFEDRFNSLTAGLNAERASLSSQRGEVQARQEAELAEVIREANEKMTALTAAAVECQDKTRSAEEEVATRINESVARVAEQLEAEIMTRLDEQAERVNSTTQRQAMEHHTMQQEIQATLAEVKASVESSLMGMRRQYHDAVQEQLRAVVQQAEAFEEQRRAECPVADSDRVDLMVQELQGASTMLEGLMQSAASRERHDPALPGRLDSLEAKLAGVEAAFNAFRENATDASIAAPLRIMVSIPVQTEVGPEAGVPGRGPTVEEQVAVRAQRHLAEELDKAADEVRLASARKVLGRAAGGRPSGSASMPQPSPTAPNTSRASVHRDPLPRPSESAAHSARTASVAPAPLDSRDIAAMADGELQDRLAQKRLTLQKVQDLLRSIQATFHALSEQEEAQGHTWSRDKVAEVAHQKQEMYARERQLMEQRNAVWQTVVALSEEGERRRLVLTN